MRNLSLHKKCLKFMFWSHCLHNFSYAFFKLKLSKPDLLDFCNNMSKSLNSCKNLNGAALTRRIYVRVKVYHCFSTNQKLLEENHKHIEVFIICKILKSAVYSSSSFRHLWNSLERLITKYQQDFAFAVFRMFKGHQKQ